VDKTEVRLLDDTIEMIPFRLEQLPQDLRWQVEQFLAERPASPAARYRPEMIAMRNRWLAFIGPVLQEGAAGLGSTPCAALEDFNRRFARTIV